MGRKLIKGTNDLATVNPQLAKEWNYELNDKTPQEYTANSNKEVYWTLPYDDPHTGRHFDFVWKASIKNRNKGNGCPVFSGKLVWPGFNDLATVNPQLAKEWDYQKNDKTPQEYTANSMEEVYWKLPYDDPQTGKHFDFVWSASIVSRNNGRGCPYLSINPQAWPGFNDLATVNPQLAKEWNYELNDKTPQEYTANSNKEVYWTLPYDDPHTGRHFDFVWSASIQNRNRGQGCPVFNGKLVWPGFNDLATVNPQLAKEWNYELNDKTPQDYTAGSKDKVYWKLPYDDPHTGKHFDFVWQASINSRNKGNGCPVFNGKLVWPGFNDLATVNPQLAKEWDYQKNYKSPQEYTANSNEKVYWKLPYDDPQTGKHFDFVWQATINSRNRGSGCPYLNSSKTVILLQNFFKQENISFISEYRFSNCKDKIPLPFDFYLNQHNITFEPDGLQHFEFVDYFYKTKEEFLLRIDHDNQKNTYCMEHGIYLLRIPYIYDPVKDKKKIEQLVKEFLRTKRVPKEILDFYAQYEFSNYVECIQALEENLAIAA